MKTREPTQPGPGHNTNPPGAQFLICWQCTETLVFTLAAGGRTLGEFCSWLRPFSVLAETGKKQRALRGRSMPFFSWTTVGYPAYLLASYSQLLFYTSKSIKHRKHNQRDVSPYGTFEEHCALTGNCFVNFDSPMLRRNVGSPAYRVEKHLGCVPFERKLHASQRLTQTFPPAACSFVINPAVVNMVCRHNL